MVNLMIILTITRITMILIYGTILDNLVDEVRKKKEGGKVLLARRFCAHYMRRWNGTVSGALLRTLT